MTYYLFNNYLNESFTFRVLRLVELFIKLLFLLFLSSLSIKLIYQKIKGIE